MMEEIQEDAFESGAVEADVRIKRGFSIVWLVPLVAAIIGGWLIFKAVTEKGPVITIVFESAEGLEAEKTKIKYKDVEVGLVKQINLDEALNHVMVTAELVRDVKKYLTTDTRFWVVKARVTAGEVSGLSTLFSGAYIGMAPGRKGETALQFKGLEIPPVLTLTQPGGHFILKAEELGSLDVGSPVYHRRIKVGMVEGYVLEKKGRLLDVQIFIEAPYHEKVQKNTRFWNASGLDVSLDAKGLHVGTESFVSMLIGGVAFDTPPDIDSGGAAGEKDSFRLFSNKKIAFEKQYTIRDRSLLYFDGPVRGLQVGAPVEFRGIQIGQVIDIKLEYHPELKSFTIPVLIETEPERVTVIGKKSGQSKNGAPVEALIKKGLRAQLKSSNLLTGQLFVDLNLYPNEPAVKVRHVGKYPVIPSTPSTMEEITANLSQFITKLNNLPIDQIGGDLQEAMRGARRLMNSNELADAITALSLTLQEARLLVGSMNKDVAPGVLATLEKLQSTLDTVKQLSGDDSFLIIEAERAMTELAEASRSIRSLADFLERHPESLIRGKGVE
ncbi:MAG: MlaD family protein [Desulfobacterales bacterium]|jgi:paraquat-inducible protein B|nr:MlaD family protein [Desulfobacterales bacterium]